MKKKIKIILIFNLRYGGVGFDKFLSDINLLNKLVNNQD